MMWPYDGFGWGAGGFAMGIFGFIFWIFIIGLIFSFFRHGRRDRYWDRRGGEDALEIAKTRYAKGEITKAEYEQLKKDLN